MQELSTADGDLPWPYPPSPATEERWRLAAACDGADPEMFFPVGSGGPAQEATARAKAICARCPVEQECRAWALVTNQQYGIWGGLDEEERRQVRRWWRRSGALRASTQRDG